MRLTTKIDQTPSGEWSWAVLNPLRQSVASGTAYATRQDAMDAAANGYRAIRQVLAGRLRTDGEPMSGYDDVDNENAAPSNADDWI